MARPTDLSPNTRQDGLPLEVTERFSGQGRQSSRYLAGRSYETYIFSFTPQGYQDPVRVTLEVPSPNIDEERTATRRDSSERKFLRESDAFDRLLPDLLRTRRGRFVAIHNGQVIDEDMDEFVLAERVERSFRDRFVLIRRVSEFAQEDFLESPEVDDG